MSTGPGHVVSVNVGRPRTRAWRGAAVLTGIYKVPVSGRVRARGVNLAGDAQADPVVHGGPRKAIYAYPSEHYEWWSDEFGVAPDAWGAVGENLTMRGIDEHGVAFGDVLRIGSTRLLVTEPRGPCYKLGMRMGSDEAPVRMLHSGRTGFYLGIMEEGDLGRGDAIAVEPGTLEPRVTIAELCSAFAFPADVDDDRLDELVALPGLDEEWSGHFEREQVRRRQPRDERPGERELALRDALLIAPDVVELTLVDPSGAALPDHLPGQFVPLLATVEGREQVRCYSLVDPHVDQRRGYRIAIRRSRDGLASDAPSVSRWLHDNRDGLASVRVRDPAGAFVLDDRTSPVALVAGGIGITPIVSLAGALVERERPFWLLFGVRSGDELIYADRLAQLAASDACRGVHVFSGPPLPAAIAGVTFHQSPIVEPDLLWASDPPVDWDLFVCGPAAMQEAVTDAALARGLAPERVHVESFGPGTAAPAGAGSQEVFFDRRSLAVLWSDPATTLLDLAEQHRIPIPYSCRSGSCGTCRVRIVTGEVVYVRRPAAPVADGDCLACVAYPVSSLVVDA